VELYGTAGVLSITEVEQKSGYPVRFEVQGGAWGDRPEAERGKAAGGAREFAVDLSAQPFLQGEHLSIGEPHVYADIMELVAAIREDRPTRAPGEQARHVVEIIEAAHRAAETGQAQDLTSTFTPGGIR
jgi:predicted dehydrogenase